jgi:hypothetical protein
MKDMTPELDRQADKVANVNGGGGSIAVGTAGSCHSVTLIPRDDLPPRKRKLSHETGAEEPESQVTLALLFFHS